jgi:hypothetical protein
MESKNKFTPGPWDTAPWGDKSNLQGCTNVVAPATETVIASDIPKVDAQFIAAAPDLYNALSLFVEDIPGGYSLSEWYEERAQIAWAALKKARGEE